MKYLKIILLISTAIMLILAIILISSVFHLADNLEMVSKTETNSIRIEVDNNVLYLKTKGYGFVGNHERIVLSKSKDSITSHKFDYIFYTSEIFYKVENNIIYIYAPNSSISEPLKKISNVVIKELRTSDEIMEYNNHYLCYGLERISVYQ